MASAFDHMRDMNDVKFKARRLNTLIKDYVPDEEHPFKDYSSASRVTNEILTHGLLSEFEVGDDDDKDVKSVLKWKRAVDLWEQRLTDLVSSHSIGNCWFGISFLGLTSQFIGTRRFEASYALWLQRLLPLVQSPAASDLVKVALWYSLSDMLTRLALGNFPDGKRDGISFAGKLVQPLLNSLSEIKSPDALEGAATILCTVVTFFPTAVNRHSDAFEASVVKSLFSEKDQDNLTILAQCLAELPKSKGDEMSWCLMMQKLLISINIHLNYVFQGLEEDSICDEAIRRLIPPGKERPLPLGGREVSPEAAEAVSKYLLLCCLKLLSSSYPVPVTVPVEAILALIERVLIVDGSLAKSTYPFITVMQQESACSQLPMLHEHCLDMLAALIKLVGSQLLPHSPKIDRLFKEYFNRCALPRLRVKIYSTLQIMLQSMGPGIGWHIRKYAIKNAFIDLESIAASVRSRLSKSSNMVSKESLLVPCDRKRKHNVATESPNLQQKVGLEVQASVMIAALDSLNTLLLKDCLSNDNNLKSQIDNLLIAVANAACKKRGWAKETNNTISPNTHSPDWADIQVASLKALKTSFLSPTCVRPPHLAEGLMLFRRGALQAGTKIGDVCTDALASLEVVIHPRALSIADFTPAGSNCATNGYQKDYTMGMVADERDTDEDILFRSFLENEYEAEIPTPDLNQKEDSVKQQLQNLKRLQPEIFTSKSDDDPKPSADAAQEAMTVDIVPEKLTEPTNEVLIEQKQQHEPALHSHEAPTFPSVPTVDINENISLHATDDASFSQASNSMADVHVDDGFNGTTEATVSTARTTMFELFKPGNTEDMDSFPDIVDAEPDSDSDWRP